MAVSEQPQVTLIQDPVLIEGCQATWGFGNQLYLFAAKGQPKSGDVPTIKLEAPFVHEIKWGTDLHGPITRKLVNESHNVFLKLQTHVKDHGEKSNKAVMVKFSREYRSVIKACVMELQQALERPGLTTEKERKETEGQLQLLEIVELVWNLCEILFIDTQPGGVVLSQLLEWLRWHFVEGDRIEQDALKQDNPEEHPQYWEAVESLVLQGRIDKARNLLSAHPDRQNPAYASLEELLAKMPLFALYRGHSLAEFEVRWRHWQSECLRRVEAAEFAANANLETIARILCGEDEVFAQLNSVCESWYCMMVSRLLYQNPGVRAFDLQHHSQFCIDVYGGKFNLQPMDNILLAALEFDIHQVIRESSSCMGNWWFVSHLTDLLHHSAVLEPQTLYFGSNLREFLLLEYSCSLMSHHSLWQAATDYLDHCSEFGRSYLEAFVERLPLETERKAQKVVQLCEKRNMKTQAKGVCKVMGMKYLHKKHLGSAFSWALRSEDVQFITSLAERFLEDYNATGNFECLELLDNLGPAMLLSSKLTFLGKYREFHKMYQDGEFNAAASLLLSLLTAKIAPKRFWVTLLTDALPLLEAKDIIFSSQQTYELMRCLEELSTEERLDQVKGKLEPMGENQIQNLEMMKLALARNLARAFIKEGTIKA